jgi:hypothetical protein
MNGMNGIEGIAKEALRQQMLLRALWRDARPGVVAGWLRDGARFEHGLRAYQGNAGALAERALAAAFPTLRQLLGGESFAALARDFWRRQPPVHGDIGAWGAALPAFIADAEPLAGEPYLPDVARLEWALHAAERAADAAPVPAADLSLLAEADPAVLRLTLASGTALLASAHPVVTVWQAHRSEAEDRFAPVRAAFDAGRRENALVHRRGWQAVVRAVDDGTARFTAALLAGRPLGAALAVAAGETFDFEPWLLAALQSGLITAVSLETA